MLLTALGGETAGASVSDPLGREIRAGFGLIEDSGTAIVEAAEASGAQRLRPGEQGGSSRGTGELVIAAIEAGAAVVLVATGGCATNDGGRGAVEAIREAGGLRGARPVVLSAREPAAHGPPGGGVGLGATLGSKPAAVAPGPPLGGAGLAATLAAELGARVERGGPFVLEALGFDDRMRAAKAVITGGRRLDADTLRGGLVAEVATRARQGGVPCHAVCGQNALSPFDARILDLQRIVEAATPAALEDAGAFVAANL